MSDNPTVTIADKSNNKIIFFSIGVIIFILLSSLILFIFRDKTASVLACLNPRDKPLEVTQSVEISPLFQSQSASLQGQIVKVDEGIVSFIDSSGKKDLFPLAKNAVVYRQLRDTQIASPSADIQNLEPGKEVLVLLSVIDNQYQIVSISYLQNF